MVDSDPTLILPPGMTPSGRTSGESSAGAASHRWEPPTVEEMRLLLPAYEVRRLIGRGGMGAVYEGLQKTLDRPVAIKVLPPDVAQRDAHFAERFQRESRAMAKLAHPGIVAVYEAGETSGGMLYFVMELVEGVDVARIIGSEGRLPPDRVLRICRDVCDALMYAHERGIVHRDVTPSNIIIDRQGHVKVADFGLAKLELDALGWQASSTVMGKPDFMAPESFIPGLKIDGRADVYALGVSLYQMLTGTLPRGRFELPSHLVVGVDARLDAIIDRAMQTDREKRYSSAAEVRSDLEVILTHSVTREVRAVTSAQTVHAPGHTMSVRVPGGPARRQAAWPLEKVALVAGVAALAGVGLVLWNQVKMAGAAAASAPTVAVSKNEPEADLPAKRFRGKATMSIPVQTSAIRSSSQLHWQWSHPAPQGSGLMDVLWDGRRFIAVGDRSAILTSSDGSEWALQGSYDVPWLGGIASNGKGYVICGASFLKQEPLLFSPDGETWKRLDFKSPDLEAVAWTGTQYVAVGKDGTVATSATGSTGWSLLAAGNSRYFGVAAHAGTTVIVGSGGHILSSSDGRRWFERKSGITGDLTAVAWAGSRWVAVGTAGTVLVSSDGVKWERRNCATSQNLLAVCWTGRRLISGGRGGTAWTSDDGENWQPVSSGTTQDIQAIHHNGMGAVMVGDGGMLLSSNDEGSTWHERTRALTHNALIAVAAAPKNVVAVGYAGVILRSTDGSRWSPCESGTSFTLNRVIWTGSAYMAVGYKGAILTSADGVAWQKMSSGIEAPLLAVAYNGRSYVTVGAGGVILTSNAGKAWAERQSNTTADLIAVTWTGTEFVAAGTGGTMLRSTDGITWKTVPTPVEDDLTAVIWTGEHVLAVSFQNRSIATADFKSWRESSPRLFAGGANAMIWHQGLAFVVGMFGSCAVSADCERWLGSGALVEPTGNHLSDACIFEGKVIVVGDKGTILTGDWFATPPDFTSVSSLPKDEPDSLIAPKSTGPPVDALSFGGSRYKFIRQNTTWTGAKQLAEAMGGHLATLTSAAENDWLRQSIPAGIGAVALGGEKNRPGQWTWITGEPWLYTAWAQTADGAVAEPSGHGADKLEWIAYEPNYKPLDGWNDIFDDESLEVRPSIRAFLVEWDTPTIAVPAEAKRTVFVVDCSAKLQGAGFEQVKRNLADRLKQMKVDETFAIIFFNDGLIQPPGANVLQPVTAANLSKADIWMKDLQAQGGANLLPAVMAALALQPSQVWLLSSSEVDDVTVNAVLAANAGGHQASISTIGWLVDATSLRRIAEQTQGEYRHIASPQ
jgi:photosystem II stability/assembly factor-like uncharacterized protein